MSLFKEGLQELDDLSEKLRSLDREIFQEKIAEKKLTNLVEEVKKEKESLSKETDRLHNYTLTLENEIRIVEKATKSVSEANELLERNLRELLPKSKEECVKIAKNATDYEENLDSLNKFSKTVYNDLDANDEVWKSHQETVKRVKELRDEFEEKKKQLDVKRRKRELQLELEKRRKELEELTRDEFELDSELGELEKKREDMRRAFIQLKLSQTPKPRNDGTVNMDITVKDIQDCTVNLPCGSPQRQEQHREQQQQMAKTGNEGMDTSVKDSQDCTINVPRGLPQRQEKQEQEQPARTGNEGKPSMDVTMKDVQDCTAVNLPDNLPQQREQHQEQQRMSKADNEKVHSMSIEIKEGCPVSLPDDLLQYQRQERTAKENEGTLRMDTAGKNIQDSTVIHLDESQQQRQQQQEQHTGKTRNEGTPTMVIGVKAVQECTVNQRDDVPQQQQQQQQQQKENNESEKQEHPEQLHDEMEQDIEDSTVNLIGSLTQQQKGIQSEKQKEKQQQLQEEGQGREKEQQRAEGRIDEKDTNNKVCIPGCTQMKPLAFSTPMPQTMLSLPSFKQVMPSPICIESQGLLSKLSTLELSSKDKEKAPEVLAKKGGTHTADIKLNEKEAPELLQKADFKIPLEIPRKQVLISPQKESIEDEIACKTVPKLDASPELSSKKNTPKKAEIRVPLDKSPTLNSPNKTSKEKTSPKLKLQDSLFHIPKHNVIDESKLVDVTPPKVQKLDKNWSPLADPINGDARKNFGKESSFNFSAIFDNPGKETSATPDSTPFFFNLGESTNGFSFGSGAGSLFGKNDDDKETDFFSKITPSANPFAEIFGGNGNTSRDNSHFNFFDSSDKK